MPQLYPADLPMPRERAKAPCSPAQIVGFLALADTHPVLERRRILACELSVWELAGHVPMTSASRINPPKPVGALIGS